jgi:hypothetical protein
VRAPWSILQAMLQGILQGAGPVDYYLSANEVKGLLLLDPRSWILVFGKHF